ncbi:hypothetical protein Goshw_006693 [Gossypium schwendimanii]|uniref:Uncharacterized protein n=1 Tax=Gossypium schwendimanii TaxID=34291 RepID=A0A7J9KJV3_GOSSC|nr:hypothetical protein [Gossypium schwendimanii]
MWETISVRRKKMMKWMQETNLVFQEFWRQNNMRVPNYPLDMFGPTHPKPEGNEEIEESKDEEGEEEGNEMDFRRRMIELKTFNFIFWIEPHMKEARQFRAFNEQGRKQPTIRLQ